MLQTERNKKNKWSENNIFNLHGFDAQFLRALVININEKSNKIVKRFLINYHDWFLRKTKCKI